MNCNISFAVAGPFAALVHAIAMHESSCNPDAKGSDPYARGILQFHPATFKQCYGMMARDFPQSLSDTWIEADIKAAASYFQMHEHQDRDLLIQSWRLGHAAVFVEGERDPEYLAKVRENLDRLNGIVK